MGDKYMFANISIEGKSNKKIYIDIMNQLLYYATSVDKRKADISKLLRFLKFDEYKKVNLLEQSIVLLEDTEDAIIEYYKNGLSKKSLGEYYLRLYGILSAASLQYEALIELNRLMDTGIDVINLKGDSEAYKLRNILSSHTLSYKEDWGQKHVSSFMSRFALALHYQHGQRILITDENGEHSNVNLLRVMDSFNIEAESVLNRICHSFINRLDAKTVESFSEILSTFEMIDNSFNYGKFTIQQ